MKRQFFALLIVAAVMPLPLLITGDHWWAFILATGAIAAALRLLLRQEWLDCVGLKLPPIHALSAVVLFVLIAIASKVLLYHVYEAAGLRATAPPLEDQIGFLFQAFNEEMFFRALLIGLLVQYLPSASLISLGAAFLFAAAHFLLYRFGALHMALSPTALATLFLAGVAMNNLYLAFRHVGFSWALHAGWNVVWLPATFYDAASNRQLYEPQIFDRVLGAPTVVIAALASAILSFALLARERGRQTA